jgi:hypothetical protein
MYKVHPITGHEGPEVYRYSSTLSFNSTLDGVGGQCHAPVAVPPGRTRYQLFWRLGGPQGRSGRVRKISPPTGIRYPDRPARSESLPRLSYPGPYIYIYVCIYIYIYIYIYTVYDATMHNNSLRFNR